MTSPSELINQLGQYGVVVYIKDDRVQVRLPWSPAQTPEEVKPLLTILKNRKLAVLVYLQIEAGHYIPISDTPGSIYLKDVHGSAESKEPKEWWRLHRHAIKGANKMGRNKDLTMITRLFQDACYFSACTRYLEAKPQDKSLRGYIIEEMRYSPICVIPRGR